MRPPSPSISAQPELRVKQHEGKNAKLTLLLQRAVQELLVTLVGTQSWLVLTAVARGSQSLGQ